MRLLTAREAADLCGVQPATIRDWVRREEITPTARNGRTGENLFLEVHVLLAERRIRARRVA
jgi:DNA-binding transcriptional MerR regulator